MLQQKEPKYEVILVVITYLN